MAKRFLIGFLLLLSAAAGLRAEEFRTLREVARDARERLAVTAAAVAPQQANYVRLEGNVTALYTSPEFNFGAFGVSNSGAGLYSARVECGNNAQQLGCLGITWNDHVIVYAHLQSYLSCRVDGTDVAVIVNLLYKQLASGSWVLVTT